MGAALSSSISVEDAVKLAATPTTPGYVPPLGRPDTKNPTVFFDMQLGTGASATPLGRITMELKEDVTPKTAENFKQLATRAPGEGFKACTFHRIIPGFMCQGGDFTRGDGRGGRSIYGDKFADESFALGHRGPGILSMANAGPNTNGSQFFICVKATPFLDGKHVVFGQVIDGFGVVKALEACGSSSGKTAYPIVVADCGVVTSGGGGGAPKGGATAAAPRGGFDSHVAGVARVGVAVTPPRRAAPLPRVAPRRVVNGAVATCAACRVARCW